MRGDVLLDEGLAARDGGAVPAGPARWTRERGGTGDGDRLIHSCDEGLGEEWVEVHLGELILERQRR